MLSVAVPLLSCTPRQLPPVPAIGRYSCLEMPSGFERPGTLIRRTERGELFLVADLLANQQRDKIVFRETNVQSAAARRTGSNVGSLAIGILEKLLPGVTANVSAAAKQQWDGSVVYSGLDEERTFDEPLHNLVRHWTESNKLLEDSSYFLIRDALRARSVSLEISQERASELRLEGALQTVATAKTDVTFDRGANFRIESPLSPPLYVCVTQESVADISPPAAPGGAAGPRLISFSPVAGDAVIPPIQRQQ